MVNGNNELDLLKECAEALKLGILRETAQGLSPLNERMRRWIADYGEETFRSKNASLSPRGHGFALSRFGTGDESLILVREMDSVPGLEGWAARSMNPVFRVEKSGRVDCLNTTACELAGYLGGETGVELFQPLESAVRTATGLQSFELEIAGRLFSFLPAEVEGADFFYLYGQDVTERRYAEVALRRSEARFRELLELAPDAVLITDREGRIGYANQQAERMFEIAREQLIGSLIDSLIHEDMHVSIQEAFTANVPLQGSRVLHGCRGSGVRFPIEMRLRRIGQNGNAVIIILRDVTERERAASEIRRLNERLQRNIEELTTINEELDSFSYSISHDLRSPLRTIDGFSSILLEDYGDRLDEEGRGYLRKVRDASGFMAALIDDLLQLSRIGRTPLKREAVDLSAMASSIVDTLQKEEPRRAIVVVGEGINAAGDKNLLRAVMENLLGNAWKYTSRKETARIEFGTVREARQTVFFVRDNGAGFDMAEQDRLFRPFERLHSPSDFAGHGIGLATVQRIIKHHGGRIWAEGTEGEGATFYFTLGSESDGGDGLTDI